MNKFTTFLGSRAGKRLFNMAYSWGACLVILGATFKIAHYPYDDVFLTIGMATEIIIFFISGFDEPAREYKWNKVFPQLDVRTDALQASGQADTQALNETLSRMTARVEQLGEAYDKQLEALKAQLTLLERTRAEYAKLAEGSAQVVQGNEAIRQQMQETAARMQAIDAQYARIARAMNLDNTESSNRK